MPVHSGNFFLSQSQMEDNATYFYGLMYPKGWTLNAICGMLGNMQSESTINPGIWQNLDEGNTKLGYGLVQWTPATKYLDWCTSEGLTPSRMESASDRIEWERRNGQQYYPTSNYPETFDEFKTSTQTPEYLAWAFLLNYERPADQNQPKRATQARSWYEYLSGGPPPPPPGGNYGRMKLIYYLKRF